MHHPFLFPLQILYFQMYYPCSMNKVPLPSGTSIGTKKRRATEKKNATIRQHYYPEVIFWILDFRKMQQYDNIIIQG